MRIVIFYQSMTSAFKKPNPMNIPIKYMPYLLIALLVTIVLSALLILPVISHYSNRPKSDLIGRPSQANQTLNEVSVRDSLLHLKKETDSLKETITSLNGRDKKIRAAWLNRKEQLSLKIRQVEALPIDSQVFVFKAKTVTAKRSVRTGDGHSDISTRAAPDSGSVVSSGLVPAFASRLTSATDSASVFPVVSIPLNHIRNANEKLLRLEASDSLTEMLESILANQDSLILAYHEAVLRSETRNSLLDTQTDALQQALLLKNLELKDLKTKRRIELTGASLLLILAILF